jgi:hypothetical protein
VGIVSSTPLVEWNIGFQLMIHWSQSPIPWKHYGYRISTPLVEWNICFHLHNEDKTRRGKTRTLWILRNHANKRFYSTAEDELCFILI